MSAGARIALFGVVLAVLFGAGAIAGGAFGPEDRGHDEEPAAHGGGHGPAHEGGHSAGAVHTIALAAPTHPLNRPEPFVFTVNAGDDPVTDYDVAHERRMHVIVVRDDLTTFQHLHPEEGDAGAWSVPLTVRSPGRYRVFADHESGGEKHTPSASFTVPGRPQPRPLPEPSTRARLAGGYEVVLQRAPSGGLHFNVTRDGQPVRIEPYLGAAGHLVAIRVEGLDYVHTHADEGSLDFGVEVERPGTHRLFLQFAHDGRVHTADFTTDL